MVAKGSRAVIAVALVLSVLAFGTAVAQVTVTEDTLVTTWGGTDTLDTFRSALAAPLFVLGLVCDTLFAFDQNLQPQPVLVESWEQSDDEMTWSFALKEGITFHDGTPLNAAEIETYLEELFFPQSFTGWMFSNVEDVLVTGEYTFDFVLSAPVPLMIFNLAYPWNIIQPAGAYEEYGDAYGYDALVGTGPFVFEEWAAGEHVLLSRNPDYTHGPSFLENTGPAHFDQILIREIRESATIVNEFRVGDVNYIGIPTSHLDVVQGDPNVTAGVVTNYGSNYIEVNASGLFGSDWRMRAAVNHAFDREGYIQAGYFGAAQPSYGLVTPASFGYWPGMDEFGKKILYYDAEEAARLLDAAGWVLPAGKTVREKDGEPLSIKLITFNFWQTQGEILAAMLTEVGMDVELFAFEYGSFYGVLEEDDWDLFLAGWIDQSGFSTLQSLVTTAGIPKLTNVTGNSNAALDALVELMNTTPEPVVREQAAAAAQQKVVSDLFEIPTVLTLSYAGVIAEEVGGFELLNAHPWRLGLILALDMYRK